MAACTHSEVAIQRKYYADSAAEYDAMHVKEGDEHMLALSMFSGVARDTAHSKLLDIGAGTGRGLCWLRDRFPNSQVVGVEPVPELREIGYKRHGLSKSELVDGDATCLPYADNEFDWVIETGVLHHIKDFRKAVREMVRVAKTGVLISDSNSMGQGPWPARAIKRSLKAAGLWNFVVWAQTGGKGYKFSVGDGVYYSFCAFDCVPIIRRKFPMITYANTLDSDGYDLYKGAPHVAILARRNCSRRDNDGIGR